jgi:hypothetical protein
VNLQFSWVLTDGFGDIQSIGPVFWIKVSAVHVNLVVEFLFCLIKIDAWTFQLDEFILFFIIRVGIVIITLFWFWAFLSHCVDSDELVVWNVL